MNREVQVRICERLGVKFPGLFGDTVEKVSARETVELEFEIIKSGQMDF